MQVFLQILAFLIANRAGIVEIIKSIEALIPDAPGAEKASAVRTAVNTLLGIDDKSEGAWALVQPIFNLLVASVKAEK